MVQSGDFCIQDTFTFSVVGNSILSVLPLFGEMIRAVEWNLIWLPPNFTISLNTVILLIASVANTYLYGEKKYIDIIFRYEENCTVMNTTNINFMIFSIML